MAAIDLDTLLKLIGNLNDSDDENSASQRFRDYLGKDVDRWTDVGEYIETALRNPGSQYNKALQDLINHIGRLLGFKVTFGRYRGVKGQIGFDGLWQSPSGSSIVVETKTTDAYTVRTATLLGYINSLVSDGFVKDRSKAIGLYIYGRFDQDSNQMENAIEAEHLRNQLRVVSVPALLGLLELKQIYGLPHDSILGLLLPAPIRIDPIVDLISGVVAKEQGRDTIPSAELPNNDSPEETEQSSHPMAGKRVATRNPRLANNSSDFTGQKVKSVTFRGTSHAVKKWREAFEAVLSDLIALDRKSFETIAPTLVGRKRPYISADPSDLRQPGEIAGTSLFFETNLSAQTLTNLAWELIERLGFMRKDLTFEVE